jgi:hypothetical protein
VEKKARSGSALVAIGTLAGCLLWGGSGCNSSVSSAQRVQQELKAVGKQQAEVLPFAGKVLVDGLPPQPKTPNSKIVVVLFNRAKPDLRVVRRPYAACNSKGEFSFTTYVPEDGVEAGEYVVAIAELSWRPKGDRFAGPDAFENLYNDPDMNEKDSQFTVKHASRGKTNYEFNLKIAGREPPSNTGPRAVTHVGGGGE